MYWPGIVPAAATPTGTGPIELKGGGEGQRGFVEDITLRYTKIFTLDNTFLVIPNGNIRERDVYNYSAEDARTRQTLDVLITYESDASEAQQLIERAGRETDDVIEGGPRIRVGAARYPAQPDGDPRQVRPRRQ